MYVFSTGNHARKLHPHATTTTAATVAAAAPWAAFGAFAKAAEQADGQAGTSFE